MIVNAYLKVSPKQWEEIKNKYVEANMYHVVENTKKNKRCDNCQYYNRCTEYEGFCSKEEALVDAGSTCDIYYE